jgi:hypothetical protein
MLPRNSKNLREEQTISVGAEYPLAIALALREEMQASQHSIKTIARWTGASERTVQNWLGAVRGPSGAHLVALAKHSPSVHVAYLALAGRADVEARDVNASVALLEEAISLLIGRR